jgi:hypothetical protein
MLHESSRHSSGVEAESLGSMLGPALIRECAGRLADLAWFRSTWQRGGAATGFARWRGDDGREVHAVVKFPVGPTEHKWTTRLGAVEPARWGSHDALSLPTPRMLAAGESLGGHDLAWIVCERLDGHTLGSEWSRQSLEDLIRATAMLQGLACRAEQVTGPSTADFDWEHVIAESRQVARTGEMPESQRWNEALRRTQKALPNVVARWQARGLNSWCHGDVHPGNAMRRAGAEETPARGCVLIDLALMHPGHWVEDAVYLERQFWSRPELLHGVQPVSALARCRRELGLGADGDYGMVANLRRVLMAACVPAQLNHDGSPRYVHAALETLERLLPQVAK